MSQFSKNITDIKSLSKEERIQKIISDMANRPTTGLITNDEVYYILSKIESRIYYITDSPVFEFESAVIACTTITYDTITDLIDGLLSLTEINYFIFYNIQVTESVKHPHPTSITRYSIRGYFRKDAIEIRNRKINEILG